MPDDRQLLEHAWAALGGPPGLTDRVELTGPASVLPSRLPVTAVTRGAVAAAALAAAELSAVRRGRDQLPAVRADSRAVGVAIRSEAHLALDGRPVRRGNPLSDFHPTGHGWIRLHGNYAHHRAALAKAFGLAGDVASGGPAVGDVLPVLAERTAVDVETAVVAAGGVAAATRTADEWLAHPQGAAVAELPLLTLDQDVAGDPALPDPGADPARLPADGLRVLDLTRVIAGPVGTRTLALLGADVLRVDSPHLPENAEQHLDTGPGKRSTRLDLTRPSDRATFDELLEYADVVVTGYRPGAMRGHGLGVPDLLTRRSDLVVVNLSAWSQVGPWGQRRGFDSLVQSASGIGVIEAKHSDHAGHADPADHADHAERRGHWADAGDGDAGAGKPGVLPAQALDHATGYLTAAAALRGLVHRHTVGGGWHGELSLAQTAAWLLRTGGAGSIPPAPVEPTADPRPWLYDVDTPDGRLTMATSPLEIDGVSRAWAHPPVPWGSSPPAWR